MAQTFTEFKTPLTKMSFTPDIPSSALQPNEYNVGQNIETDTRGIRSVFGDTQILSSIPGTPIFVSSGYRANDEYWFIVAAISNGIEGRWYAIDKNGITNITPGYGNDPNAYLPGYSYGIPITDSWNGTVLFINDSVSAPLYLLPDAEEFREYSQYGVTLTTTAASGTGTIATLTFANQGTAPYSVGNQIIVSGVVPLGYNGTYVVTGCTATTVSYVNSTTGSQTAPGQIVPNYQWNYNPDWSAVTAKFMHIYSTPNVGSILIAGNLTADVISSGTTQNYPTTVQWSQAFGLNSGPTTWAPTITNVANQLEVPVRGPVIDGFPMGGNFYICSYWDTVIFSPINYQSTSAPILGVRLLTQGRGLLNENCWANADTLVYGLDARDLWSFDGSNFKSLGNQRIKDYFYANLNPAFVDRVFVINNTQKNQIEYYYPDLTSTGWCNKMISYRYDLDIFNPPRDVSNASHATEAPLFMNGDFNTASRSVVYLQGVEDSQLVEKDQGTSFLGDTPITSIFRRDNISLGLNYSQQALLHRILPEVVNINTNGLQINGVGELTVTVGGTNSVGTDPDFKPPVTMLINTQNPWTQINQNAYRVNTLILGDSSDSTTWQCAAINWQFTPTQDAR